jgi:hypothetical protein
MKNTYPDLFVMLVSGVELDNIRFALQTCEERNLLDVCAPLFDR